MSRVLVISDLHAPYEHPEALKFLKEMKKKHKTNVVVSVGDEVDAAAFSTFSHDPDGLSPGDELKAAREHLKPFYREFPVMKLCTSNHPLRIAKRARDAGFPKELLKAYGDVLKAPKTWSWSSLFELDGVLYTHGEGMGISSNLIQSAKNNAQSVVFGHLHSKAGMQRLTTPSGKIIFGLNVGSLINPNSEAFAYAERSAAKADIGCGIVIDGIKVYWEPLE